jgi:hypothetical protein
VYGKPWSKLMNEPIELTPIIMNKLGKAVLDGVRWEIKRALALAANLGGRGQPRPLPNSPSFVESFQYRIAGSRTVEIITDWPFAKAWEEGKEPYEMSWLNRAETPVVPIITTSGEVILRAAPLTTEKAWIHPGFAKYSFLAKGIKRGRASATTIIRDEVILPLLKGGDPL